MPSQSAILSIYGCAPTPEHAGSESNIYMSSFLAQTTAIARTGRRVSHQHRTPQISVFLWYKNMSWTPSERAVYELLKIWIQLDHSTGCHGSIRKMPEEKLFFAVWAPGTNTNEYNEIVPREADWRKADEGKGRKKESEGEREIEREREGEVALSKLEHLGP